jgi:hypothetical protein
MDESVRKLVRERTGMRCEYCRLPQQEGMAVRFHVEHIRPRQHGGDDDPSNLALACPNCNWNNGPNLTTVDPATTVLTSLYNPRADDWQMNFALVGVEIIGLTATGRATIQLLRMNDPEYMESRVGYARRLCFWGIIQLAIYMRCSVEVPVVSK